MRDLVRHVVAAILLAACTGGGPTTAPGAPQSPVSTESLSATPAEAPTHSPTARANPSATSTSPATPAASASPAGAANPTDGPTPLPSQTSPAASLAWQELATADGPSAREDHTWTVSGDGQTAYLFGGRGARGPSNELWAFDLGTDAWSAVDVDPGSPTPAPRFGHTATWVPDVGLVVWSGQGASGFFDDIWAFDPEAVTWTELPNLGAVPAARYGSCASLGPDGELWISHGFTQDTGRFADTRSYDFSTGTWTDRTPLGDVPVERCLHDCFWAEDGHLVLYGGQTTGVAALGDLWAYDPQSGDWARAPEQLPPARNLYALSIYQGRGVVFGGGSIDGGYLDDYWLIGASRGTAVLIPSDFPTGPGGRAASTLIIDVLGDRWLLFGGTDASGELGDLWELK